MNSLRVEFMNFSRILIVVFTLCYSYSVKAQEIDKSLVFSKVKLLESEETVPEGKVWKIERALPKSRLGVVSRGSSYTIPDAEGFIIINSKSILIESGQVSSDNDDKRVIAYNKFVKFPIWVPEGTTVDVGEAYEYLSIIEFKVKN